MPAPLLAPVRRTLRAIAGAVVPEAERLNDAEWAEMEGIVEWAVAQRPRAMQRQLVTFIRAINVLPVARFGRTFAALDPARRTRVLRALESHPLLVLRRGFWGLRTLLFMGFYTRPEAMREIGYAADPRGWEARR